MPGQRRRRQGARDLRGRSNRAWVVRGLGALGLFAVGCFATLDSLAIAIAKADPARAHALAPSNGVILAKYAEDVFSRQPSKDPRSLPASLARRAVIADPTAAEAFAVLGFQAQLRGDKARADRLFSYSTALSRRELRPRLWAIEEAVERGDIAGALRNYDIALRTSKDAPDLLFPTLVSALTEPQIRSELLRILATRPVWEQAFFTYASTSKIEPEGVLALFSESSDKNLRLSGDQSANLVNALLARGKSDAAWAYYRSFRPGVRRDRSRDPTFALQVDTRAMFDWRTDGDRALGVAIVPEGTSGLLDFAVPPSTGGALVSQRQALPAGLYQLEGRSRGIDQPDTSKLYWGLTCLDGRELGRVVVPNSNENGGKFSGRFSVPKDCALQTLSLFARPTDRIMGVTGQIERAQLAPAR